MKRKLLALAALAAASAPAFAELPTSVSTSISTAYADVGTALGLMIVGGAVVWGTKKVLGLFGR
jgi:hypothetical protein